MTAKCVVLHTTESDPGTCEAVARYLVQHGYEPHEVFDPSNGDGVILLPMNVSGKALLNLPGGVETNNRGGVYQIEIVGRAVDVPNYDDDWYARLRTRLLEVCDFTGTPFVFPLPFQPYPQSYGNNLTRLSYEDWLTVEGLIGHSHVPENDHGDPGALDVLRLQPPPPPPLVEETDMVLITPATGIADGVFAYNGTHLRWVNDGNELALLRRKQVTEWADVTDTEMWAVIHSTGKVGDAPTSGAYAGSW